MLSTARLAGTDVLYDLTVEDFHTFAVTQAQVWVHNCGSTQGGFTSTDKHVADVANAIEKAHPGHVVGVNVPMKRADGSMITDADILTKNAIIQVKSGAGKGLGSQIQRTEAGTGIPTIGYGPDLKPSILKNSTSTNDLDLLIDVVKP